LASLEKKFYPIDAAWWTSLLTLSFLGPILSLGNKRTLQIEDVPMLSRDDATDKVVEVFEKEWCKWAPPIRGGNAAGAGATQPAAFKKRTSSPLARTLMGCYGWGWFIGSVSTMIGRWSLIISPLLTREFLLWVSADESARGTEAGFLFEWSDGSLSYGGMVVAALVALMIISSVFLNHSYYRGVRIGCAFRTALMSLIFEKSLRCSTFAGRPGAPAAAAGGGEKTNGTAKKKKPVAAPAPASQGGGGTGQTVNLMANDTQMLFDASTFIHFIYVEPLLTVGTVAVMYWQIGIAALAAGALMIVLLPVQIAVARRIGRNRSMMVRHTDSRVKILGEILQGIRVIKVKQTNKKSIRRAIM
jgi:ABC-type multidrug transport system fused ATPase/permease subunit